MKVFHVETDEHRGIFSGEVGFLLFFSMWEKMCRRQYEVERQNPEQFDLGGEA